MPFTITIADACETASLAFFNPVPYISKTYYLHDPSFELYQAPEKFIGKKQLSLTDVDCGPYSIVFFNSNNNKAVSSTLFDVKEFNFKVRYTEKILDTGDYTISYKIFFTNYPTGPVLLQTVPFMITIADPC